MAQKYIPPFKRNPGIKTEVDDQIPDNQKSPDPCKYKRSKIQGSYREKRSGFSQVINNLVDLFHHQRVRGHQFSVLYLSLEEELTVENVAFKTKGGVVSTPDEATDKDCAVFPPDENSLNYLTARPDGKNHAEALILERFNSLTRSFYRAHRHTFKTILLFTWILPCDQCKEKILQELQWEKKQLTIVYVTAGEKDKEQERSTVQDLESAGITVKKTVYAHILPILELS